MMTSFAGWVAWRVGHVERDVVIEVGELVNNTFTQVFLPAGISFTGKRMVMWEE
jgi:hypothetical protein